MIHDLYQKAGEIHGHYCPGLAIGVRAAAEAVAMLDIGDIHGHDHCCIAEHRACYIDGIQVVAGCTIGGGNLEIRPRGKSAFNFYNRKNGTSIRLITKPWPEDMTREETAEFILTAPLEQVFEQTPVHFPVPKDGFRRRKSVVCPRCGEECAELFLRIDDGETVCLDCSEQGAL